MQKEVLIINDNERSITRLEEMLHAFDSEIVIHGARTCAEARVALRARDDYNLIFSSSKLAGGDLFEVFRETPPQSFVVFTSVHDRCARRVIGKLRSGRLLGVKGEIVPLRVLSWLYKASLNLLGIQTNAGDALRYKGRLLVRQGGQYSLLCMQDVQYFRREDDYVLARMNDGTKYLVRDTIRNLQHYIDPNQFFAPNRQYLISRDSVLDVKLCGKFLCVMITNSEDTPVKVSRNRVKAFKDWLDEHPAAKE